MEVFTLIEMKLGIINFLRVEVPLFFLVLYLRLNVDVNMNQEVK